MKGLRLRVVNGKNLAAAAPACPRALFCAMMRTFDSGQPAMGEQESGLMCVRIQTYCWFSASQSGARWFMKATPL